MNEITNTRMTQNFHDTRVLTFIFMDRKTSRDDLQGEYSFFYLKRKNIYDVFFMIIIICSIRSNF